MNYRSMQGLTNSATIGIQDANGVEGTLVSYNYSLPQDEYSILIYKMPSWIEVSPLEGVVAPSEASEIVLNIYSYDLAVGQYFYDLTVKTNDYENANIVIPISLSIYEDSCSGWNSGDLNQDNQLNVLDITLMINIALNLMDSSECQYLAADLNQDEIVNILDILSLVNLILD